MDTRILIFTAPLLAVLGLLMILLGIAAMSISGWIEGARGLGYTSIGLGIILILVSLILLVRLRIHGSHR